MLKKDLKEVKIFDRIEKMCNCKLDIEFRQFIIANNAATPEHFNFMVGDRKEVFGAVLNFNDGDPEGSSVMTALNVVTQKKLVPFGIDPFGNYICYDWKTSHIIFWEHEQQKTSCIAKNLLEFIEGLF